MVLSFFRVSVSLLSCFCLLTGCADDAEKSGQPKQNPPVIVDVQIAEPTSVTDIIEANGTAIAGEFVELRPEVSGRLTYLNVNEGASIKKGTVVARINDADLRAQLNRSRVQLELAQTTLNRYKTLLDAGGLNQSDYDLALNTINTYKADINYTNSLLQRTVVVAPFSGTLGLRQVSPGAYVTPGTVLATVQQLGKVKIDFTLPEAYGNAVKVSDTVDVSTGDSSTGKYKAVIIATEPGASTQTRNLRVRAELVEGKVNPGAFVKVYLTGTGNRQSIMVPTNAIIPEDKNNSVIVVKNGVANFVTVRTGIRMANNVEIISGLNKGDSIVVTGVLFTRPKAKVKVRSVKPLAT